MNNPRLLGQFQQRFGQATEPLSSGTFKWVFERGGQSSALYYALSTSGIDSPGQSDMKAGECEIEEILWQTNLDSNESRFCLDFRDERIRVKRLASERFCMTVVLSMAGMEDLACGLESHQASVQVLYQSKERWQENRSWFCVSVLGHRSLDHAAYFSMSSHFQSGHRSLNGHFCCGLASSFPRYVTNQTFLRWTWSACPSSVQRSSSQIFSYM